jgi:hypothetical protein
MVKSKSRSRRASRGGGTMDAIAALVCSVLGVIAVVQLVTKWKTISTAMKVVVILLVLGALTYFIGLVPGVGMLGNWSCVIGPGLALLCLNSNKLGGCLVKDKTTKKCKSSDNSGNLWF